MSNEISLLDIPDMVGKETGLSDWLLVDQEMIDKFADATDDHQFIHVNPQKAAETQFGGTIAHGFLTLSLLSKLNFSTLPKIREQTFGVNYGFDKVRFLSPVRSGARVRARFTMADARYRGAAMLMLNYDVAVEIENEKKPALTATWLTICQFDPKDRPADA